VEAALLRLLCARDDRMAGCVSVNWDKALGWLHERTGASLAPEHEGAVKLALTSKVAVLVRGPGCGKSFTVRSVAELAKAMAGEHLSGDGEAVGNGSGASYPRALLHNRILWPGAPWLASELRAVELSIEAAFR
jgi:hypothetical protein